LHLGIESDDAPGVCTQSIAAADWIDIAIDSEYGVHCLPYGEVIEPDRLAFEEILHQQPDWIGENIRAAGLDDDAIVLIDTPPGPSVYLRQTFACADLILIVLLADAASYATITAMESWMSELRDQFPNVPHVYLLNQVDRTDLLNKDVSDVLQQRIGGMLSPIGIHLDESVREAMAFQQPVMAYDPHGQASHDMARLADYLIDSLNR
jgi:cellulose synthase operon protein YhjQ